MEEIVMNGTTEEQSQTNNVYSTIQEISDARANKLQPVVGFLSVVMFLGISGNIPVIIVYVQRFKRTATNIMIMTAAIMDVLSCLLSIPFEIVDTIYPYINGDVMIVPCKVFRFIGSTLNTSSFYIFVCLAYIRYCKVVRPLSVITSKHGVIYVGVSILVSSVTSVPMVIFYGYHTEVIIIGGKQFNGSDCSIDDDLKNSHWIMACAGFYLLNFVFCTTSIIYFYSRILRQVLMLSKRMVGTTEVQVSNCSINVPPGSISNDQWRQSGHSSVEIRMVSGKVIKSTKTHVVFAIITFTLIFCYTPIFVLSILNAPLQLDDRRKSDPDLDLLLGFLEKMYVLSFCTNPIVYTAMDGRFRNELWKLLKEKFTLHDRPDERYNV